VLRMRQAGLEQLARAEPDSRAAEPQPQKAHSLKIAFSPNRWRTSRNRRSGQDFTVDSAGP